MRNFSGAAYWYPMVTTGLFLKGGVGYRTLRLRNLSITPVANWFRGGFDGGSANVMQLGLGVTSH